MLRVDDLDTGATLLYRGAFVHEAGAPGPGYRFRGVETTDPATPSNRRRRRGRPQ